MHRYRIALVLVGMTWAGCRDGPVVVTDPGPAWTPATPAILTLRGSIVMTGGQIILHTDGGSARRLIGPEVRRLHGVVGADVLVRATDDAVGGLLVASFTLLAMDGLPAIDGVLEAVDGGYAVCPVDGSPRMLMDPPPELIDHLGARVWVTGDVSKEIVAFGSLE
jgi:hypothetical protein